MTKNPENPSEEIFKAVSYWSGLEHPNLSEELLFLRNAVNIFQENPELYEDIAEGREHSNGIGKIKTEEQDYRDFFKLATEKYPSEVQYIWGDVMDNNEPLVIEDLFKEDNKVQPASRVTEAGSLPKIKAIDNGDSVRYLGKAEAVVGIDSFSIENEFEWFSDEEWELVVSVDVSQDEALEVFSKFEKHNTV